MIKLKEMKKGIVLPFPRNVKIENAVNTSNIAFKDVEEFYKFESSDKYENISYELNKPISIIHGETQLIELLVQNEGIIDKNRLNKSINSIKQNCLKLTKTVNNIIELHRIIDRQYSLFTNKLNIVEIIDDTVMNASKIIKGKNIVFDTNIEEKFILCDLEKIQKSILILLSNAVRFSDEEEILVNLNVENDNIDITISFKNNDSNCLNILIDKMDNLNLKSFEDISIGFHICKTIINLHGGKTSVGGNTDEIYFSVKLPCENTDSIYYLHRNDRVMNSENSIEQIRIEFSDIYM